MVWKRLMSDFPQMNELLYKEWKREAEAYQENCQTMFLKRGCNITYEYANSICCFWIAIIVILLLGLIQNKFSKKSQCAIVIFAIFILSFMYSNRTLGLDLRNYIEYYSSSNINRIMSTLDIKSLFLNEYEPLFTLTIVVAKKQVCLFKNGYLRLYLYHH